MYLSTAPKSPKGIFIEHNANALNWLNTFNILKIVPIEYIKEIKGSKSTNNL